MHAATTDQAIDLINAQVFDAAMLDMNLNGTKNSSVADALAARGVPFIFSTGYSHNIMEGYPDRPILKKLRNWPQYLRVSLLNDRVSHQLILPDRPIVNFVCIEQKL
jgi:hypothetical protein